MSSGNQEKPIRKPLGMSCTDSDCNNGLHCFRSTQKMAAANQKGVCRYCGANLVDWERVYERKLADVSYTFEALKTEYVRHEVWHLEIDQKAVNHARRKGRIGMRESAANRIRKYVAPTNNPFDGRQTPWEGNAIYYAQHATATCCRRCLEEWHNIPRRQELTEEEIAYCTDLVMLFINERLPFLTEDGEKIPSMRKQLFGNGITHENGK